MCRIVGTTKGKEREERRSLSLAMVGQNSRCSPGSELKPLRNTKLLYLRPFVHFVSPGEAIFFLSFLHCEVFRPLYLIMPLYTSADLGTTSKTGGKTDASRRFRLENQETWFRASFFYKIWRFLCSIMLFFGTSSVYK